jgi:hypothetical protein
MFFPVHRVVSFVALALTAVTGIGAGMASLATTVSRAGHLAQRTSTFACSSGFHRSSPTGTGRADRSGRESVRRHGLTATLVAQRAWDRGAVVSDARIVVRRSGRGSATRQIQVPRWAEYEPGRIALEPLTSSRRPESMCIAEFTRGHPVVVLGISTGNNCCSALELFPVRSGRISDPVFDELASHRPQLRTVRHHALVFTADWLECGITDCADGGSPIVLQTMRGTRVRDVTRHHKRLLRSDARYWFRQYAEDPRYGLGSLAAWIGDRCRLGSGASPWPRVHRLLVAGKLHGISGWPHGQGFVTEAHHELRQDGLCS